MQEEKNKPAGEKERYNPQEKEPYWQRFWEKERVFAFNPDSPKEVFSIDTPPPTVSGALHLGHVYSYTHAEIIARYRRMAGFNVRYPMGMDNNGLPTERLVEKEIGMRGKDMKLEDFISSCLNIIERYKKMYKDLFISIGLSVDWKLEYYSISPGIQILAQSVFKDFYERKLIYRKDAPALYCPECRTSFAQAEKEDKEKDAVFFDLIFKAEDGKDLIISTTRPELLPACAAVFVNPEDKRYKQFVGKKIMTPLGHEVVILTDKKAEIEKGSGAVMCCTYGDETDIYWAKTYGLQERIILDMDGKMQNIDELPELNGKTPDAARAIIIENLRGGGFVKKEEKIRHSIGVHERCGTPVEFLPTAQWFVKILDMKDKLLEAGNKIKWHPDYMQKRYEEWVQGLKWDWCISRERFFGISVPVFICNRCQYIFIPDKKEFPIDPRKEKELKTCPSCKNGKLEPDRGIFDTWFTSALTPDINNNSLANGKLAGKMYPMSMRPQAHDIIRTWAVYTILMGLYRHNEIPWKELMISGHILLQKGEKISKKTGGGKYKPEELIANHSADAIRYAMCGASLGRDGYFDEKEVQNGKKLATKIYNAGKLVLGNLAGFSVGSVKNEVELEAVDRWILDLSRNTARGMAKEFESYEYAGALKLFEDFFWRDLCDNYLEIVKGRLRNSSGKELAMAQYALYNVYLNVLKMVSPFIPHITEEMYHAEYSQEKGFRSDEASGFFANEEKIKSIHSSPWPKMPAKDLLDEKEKQGIDLVIKIIGEVRKFKTANQTGPGAQLSSLVLKGTAEQESLITPFLKDLASVTRTDKITFKEEGGGGGLVLTL